MSAGRQVWRLVCLPFNHPIALASRGIGPLYWLVSGRGLLFGCPSLIPCLSHRRRVSYPYELQFGLTYRRRQLVLTIAHIHGPQTFNRPDLRDDVEDADDVEVVINDKDRVLVSLKYTRLLNDLTDDGYLVKEFQGGTNPILLDVEYDSDRDTRNAAPWGNPSALHTLVSQVCDREGISRDLLNEANNQYDFNEVKDKVNSVVGRRVLRPYADPSKYRFTQEGYSIVFEKVEEARASDE